MASNPSTFPVLVESVVWKSHHGQRRLSPDGGLSLRDYFAGQALIGFLACFGEVGAKARENPSAAAEWAYEQADAMLVQREKATHV